MNTCPICSGPFEKEKCRTVPYPAESEEAFKKRPKSIIFCENCGIGIAAPAWDIEELEKFYCEGSYWKNPKVEILSPKKHPGPYALAVSRWELIEPLLERTAKPISILDVGAGYGFFGMAAVKNKNLRLSSYVCVEKDRTLIESLKKTWSVSFPKISLEIKEHIGQVDGTFDLIILSHILEHLTDPKTFLITVLAKLAKNGLLFIDVPNQDYLFKKDVFPHFLFFNKLSLQMLLKNYGLKIKLIDCYGTDMNRSQLNYRNVSILDKAFIKIIFGLSPIIPEKNFLSFFSWYLGTSEQNNKGTWVRAIAQNSRIS